MKMKPATTRSRGGVGRCRAFPCAPALLCRVASIGLILLSAAACRPPTLGDRVAALEPLLTAPATTPVDRTTRDDRSQKGAPVSVVELRFNSLRPISPLRDYYDDLLITQHRYSQTVNISTPTAIHVEYATRDGNIYITLDAQTASTPPPDATATSGAGVHLVISYLKRR